MEILGVIPAAGHAKRMGDLPHSKEVLQVPDPRDPVAPPKPVMQYLLDRLRAAGADRVYIVLRDGKWDIPETFGDGSRLAMSLAYLLVHRPEGPAYTVDQANAFTRDGLVLLGFPDIRYEPEDAFVELMRKQAASGADVVLGLFPTDRPRKMDMVATAPDGRVAAIDIKPEVTELTFAWILAVWTPAFTAYLHHYLKRLDREAGAAPIDREIHIGEVIQAAIASGMYVSSVSFPEGYCLDIGTPEDLARLEFFGQPAVGDHPPPPELGSGTSDPNPPAADLR